MTDFERLCPMLVIALSLTASAIYFFAGDTRRCIYWAAAAVLTASVTY